MHDKPSSSSESSPRYRKMPESLKEKIIDEEIEPALKDINFTGFDFQVVGQISDKLVELMEEFEMTKEERAELIDLVRGHLKESEKYMEQMAPVEMVQSLLSLVTTGTLGHFLDYIPVEGEKDTLQSLDWFAIRIKNRREFKKLRNKIDKK